MCKRTIGYFVDVNMYSGTSSSDSNVSDSDASVEELVGSHEESEILDDAVEDEDEVIKAIKKERDKKRDHPPVIHCEDFVMDFSFHPFENMLAVGSIVGDVILYKYSNEENSVLQTLELHTKACRDVEFSHDGKTLFSTSKDRSIMLTDVQTGGLIRFYDNSHEVALYCLRVVDENMFATGDDDGEVKIWDLRQKSDKPIFSTKKNEDYISDIVADAAHKFLLCSSGDGSLTTIDLENRKVHMLSEEYEEELTCLGLFRNGTKLLAGSSKGKLYLYNWNEFGLHSDAFPGPKHAINGLIPITENIVVTACEDGILRATHLFPHRHLGVVGQHDMSIENVDICNNGMFIASSSHDNDIKFWNIQYFEDFERVSHKHKKHETKQDLVKHLPSSKVKTADSFFNDLS
ncbi:WD repeat-containing protein 55 homolog [Cylas formicarius]|uniref:WD repeat-containing protein 55 homolog n=1 Tax=Cylas formicarius TaxID=197179 RepID=UPI002958A74C|nr:WD repeat-containing protein 55 homolog [Cylas formicarius]